MKRLFILFAVVFAVSCEEIIEVDGPINTVSNFNIHYYIPVDSNALRFFNYQVSFSDNQGNHSISTIGEFSIANNSFNRHQSYSVDEVVFPLEVEVQVLLTPKVSFDTPCSFTYYLPEAFFCPIIMMKDNTMFDISKSWRDRVTSEEVDSTIAEVMNTLPLSYTSIATYTIDGSSLKEL